MRQIGAYPRSPLTALAEHIQTVRALLAGETVSMAGDYVQLDGVRLDHPPAYAPSVLAGVRGPRSLELSGRLADGTPVSVDPDPARARDAVRAAVAAELAGPTGSIHIEPLGIAAGIKQLLAAAGSTERLAADLPDRWIDQLVIAGDLTHCADRIASLTAQSIDHVILGSLPGR